MIRTSYPNLGRLANAGDLLVARDRIRKAWQTYERASAHLRAESAQQQAQGIFTLGRGSFGNEQQTQQFLAAEACVRALVAPTIEKFWQDQIVRFDTDVITGNPLPLADQVEINFFRFFQGLDLRDTYFRTILDPFTNRRTMGVSSLAELTTRMATFGDVLVSIGGQAPTAGDLQQLVYSLRVEAPPQSTKTIDGNFGDWATGSLLVLSPPSAWVEHPAPDLGSLHLSVDNDALYVRVDRDVLPYLTNFDDRFEIVVEGPSGSIGLIYTSGGGFQPTTSYGLLPTFAHDASGLEIRFPLGSGTGEWASLERSIRADNSAWSIDVDQQPVFVKVN